MTYGEEGSFDAAYTYGVERIEVEALDNTRPEAQDPLYYLYDGLGSVAFMVKPDGNMRDHYRYDEFGKPAPGNSKLSSDGVNVNHNSFGYTGEMWDEESELLYLRARYYEPETGRFLSRDSYEGELENPLTKHLYAYVGNNPVNRTDPSGNKYLDHDIDIGDHGFNQDLKTLLNVRPDVAERSFNYNETWYLQWSLNNQGYRDYEGRKLKVDGRYKQRTSSAHFKWWYANNAHFQGTREDKSKKPIIAKQTLNLTVSLGGVGSLAGGIGVTGSVAGVIDMKGNTSAFVTAGGGGGTPNGGFTGQIIFMNAPTIYDLLGSGFSTGGAVLVGGVEYVQSGKYKGVAIDIGRVSPIPVEMHGYYTYTLDLNPSSKQRDSIRAKVQNQINYLNQSLPIETKKQINDYLGQQVFIVD